MTYRDGYLYGQHDVLTWLSQPPHPDDHPLAALTDAIHLRASMICLARNISVGAALFAAFRAGDNFGFHMGSDETQCTCQWAPGAGEPYHKSTRCEQEQIYEGCDDYETPATGPNGCTCGFNGDCNCPFVETV